MRYVRKGAEPQSLLEHRLTPAATYDNFRQKDELRQLLVREQGHLCCYCMQRITPTAEGMKIEHWAPQADPATSARQLDWKNLLGACKGGEGSPWRDQHCDTRKGEAHITVSPLEERCERLVRFLADGTIESDDPTIRQDLNQTLNLNHPRLKNNRKAVLDAFVEAMVRKNARTWPETVMDQALQELQHPGAEGRLQEFCQVPIYWLKKRLGRAHH